MIYIETELILKTTTPMTFQNPELSPLLVYCSSAYVLIECGNYHLISLMSHITIIILRIIIQRVRNKLLPEISEEQFGFKKDCCTRDAIFMLRIFRERSIKMQLDMHMACIDYEKKFD